MPLPEPPFSFKAYISKIGVEENSGTTLVKYSPPVGKKESVRAGRTRVTDVKYNCISFLKEYEDKSLEELRLEDYTAGRISKEPALGHFLYKFLSNAERAPNPRSPIKKTGAKLAYEVLSKRFETKLFKPKKRCGIGEQSSGSAVVKYIPKVDKDVTIVCGVVENMRVQVNCITAMKEYEDKSMEELRLEDYKAGRKLLAKYIKDFDETRSTNKSNVFVFGFKKSHVFCFRDNEQIDTEPNGGVGEQSSGSALVKYIPKVDKDVTIVCGVVENMRVQVNCITAMKEYEDKSVEELRLEDYRAGRKPQPKGPLKFHCVHGENIRLSEDRTTAERTYSHYGGVTFTSRPVRVGEKVYVQLVKISKNWATLSGMCFGFTTENPSGIAHSVPIFGNNLKNSWIINLNKELCKKDTILHYYVNNIGELRFGVNGKIQKEILSKVDINRPLWAVIDVYGRCKMVQFVGPAVLEAVRQPDQGVDGVRQPDQAVDRARQTIISQIEEVGRSNQVVDRARQSIQVIGGVRQPNLSQIDKATHPDQVVDGVRQPKEVVNGLRQLNLNQFGEGAKRPNQSHIIDCAGRSNQVIDNARRPNLSQIGDETRLPDVTQVVEEARRLKQALDGATQSNQSQIGVGAKQSKQIVVAIRCSEHVVDGANRPNEVVDAVRRPNLSQIGDGVRQSNQIVDAVRCSEHVVDEARRPVQLLDGARQPNLSQIGDGARQSNQFVGAIRCTEHLVGGSRPPSEIVDSVRQPNQVIDGARRPNQVLDTVRRPNQVINGTSRPNEVVSGARRPDDQLLDEARQPDLSPDEDDPLINELQSLSVAEPAQSRPNRNSALFLHRTKGRNINFTGRGVATRHPRESCQGYVFSSRPMKPGQTITVQILDTDDNPGSLTIGFTSCNPGSLNPDELPDEAEFLLDRPEYWVVYSDAANGLIKGDELEITLTRDGRVEVNSSTRNGISLITVLHVDHTLKLWAFFDVYGATRVVRFYISKASPDQDLDGVRRNNQVLDRPRHNHQLLDEPRQSNNQVSDRPRHHAQVLDGARQSNRNLDSARQSNQNLDRARQNRTPSSSSSEEEKPSTSQSFRDQFPRTECLICFDSPINSVLYKCGHMCMCYDCAVQQWKNYGKVYGKCPLCRATIKDVIRTYNS